MYCDLPSSRRNELAVCQSCPSMYHRRCAKAAGLVDAWQCRQCVLPSVYRARPVRPPRASQVGVPPTPTPTGGVWGVQCLAVAKYVLLDP